MKTQVFINKTKMLKTLALAMLGYSISLFLAVYFGVKNQFFLDLNIFKIAIIFVYAFIMTSWTKSIFIYKTLLFQKKPLVEINENGLIFYRGSESIIIAWQQVIKIHKIFNSGVGIIFAKNSKRDYQFPFSGYTPYPMVAINNTQKKPQEIYTLLIQHKDKFGKDSVLS